MAYNLEVMGKAGFEYVGFWLRVVASVIDQLLLTLVLLPTVLLFYGKGYFDKPPDFLGFYRDGFDFFLSAIVPMIIVVTFWLKLQATPGKLAFSAIIVDAESGEAPTRRQYIIRYISYLISALPFGLGFLWVAFDPKKQGWHDKIAGTVVIRALPKKSVTFRKDDDHDFSDDEN